MLDRIEENYGPKAIQDWNVKIGHVLTVENGMRITLQMIHDVQTLLIHQGVQDDGKGFPAVITPLKKDVARTESIDQQAFRVTPPIVMLTD